MAALAALAALTGAGAPAALADGPVSPVATSYLARITQTPHGLEARIVDGYLQIWLRVPVSETAVVLDYEGAPWVRYDRSGVAINTNSEEYYLSQVPVPAVPPPGLTRTTPPHWMPVSSGHAYLWREGRLHSLTDVALAPGASFVGRWTIRLVLDGRPATISGSIYHRGAPSLLWFWPIVVVLACLAAAWRLRDVALDRRLTRWLTLALLLGIALAGCAKYLHGRPSVGAGQLAILVAILVAVGLGLWRLAAARSGYPLALAAAFASLWAGLTIAPALTHGYVLLAVPAAVARSDAALLLGGGAALIPLALRMLERSWARERPPRGARIPA